MTEYSSGKPRGKLSLGGEEQKMKMKRKMGERGREEERKGLTHEGDLNREALREVHPQWEKDGWTEERVQTYLYKIVI